MEDPIHHRMSRSNRPICASYVRIRPPTRSRPPLVLRRLDQLVVAMIRSPAKRPSLRNCRKSWQVCQGCPTCSTAVRTSTDSPEPRSWLDSLAIRPCLDSLVIRPCRDSLAIRPCLDSRAVRPCPIIRHQWNRLGSLRLQPN